MIRTSKRLTIEIIGVRIDFVIKLKINKIKVVLCFFME